MAKQRIEYIDVAKGLCIWLVVMGHLLQANMRGEGSETCFNFIYSFHMPVFMLLSGYVAALSRENMAKEGVLLFLKKKSQSLMWPFLMWGLIVSPFVVRRESFASFPSIAQSLFLHPETGAWFIIVLFWLQVYFLSFCLFTDFTHNRMMKNKGLAEVVSFLILMVVLAFSSHFVDVVNVNYSELGGGKNIFFY